MSTKTWLLAALAAATLITHQAKAHDHEACAAESQMEETLSSLRKLAGQRIQWRSKVYQGKYPTANVQVLGFNDFHGQLTEGRRAARSSSVRTMARAFPTSRPT